MKKAELLAPAGDFECLKAAVNNGADAIYLGGKNFSARAFAGNFDEEEFIRALRYAHLRDVRIYVTLNTLLNEKQLENALKMADFYYRNHVDGILIAMVFAMKYPDRVGRLILNGANLNPDGVKRSTQIPIEIGYRIAKKFSEKSDAAKLNAEMLGLMVNDPNVKPEELSAIHAKTLLIAGTNDMILEAHTRLIAESIPDSQLVLIKGNHFIANRKPEEFNQAVLAFLGQ